MTRPYRQTARAVAAEERRERIIEAAYALMSHKAYDEVSLQAIADAAGVALKTLTRQFPSKEDLMRAVLQRSPGREQGRRAVPVGDVEAAVATLVGRYEEMADNARRNLDLELRLPVAAEGFARARAGHRQWLAEVFAPWLDVDDDARERRIAALYGATEIYVWWTWRRALGLSREQAARTLAETIHALLDRWAAPDSGARHE